MAIYPLILSCSRMKALLKRLGFGVAFCAMLLRVPAAYAQVNADQVIAIGRNVLSMEDYMLAIQYFNQAISAKPYLADPYFYRALAKLNLEDYKGAERDCTLALERNKFKTEAYKLRGFARQQMGLDSLAIIDYDEGLRHNPYDKYFLYYKGIAETESKRYQSADSTLLTLLQHHPRFDEGIAAHSRLLLATADTVGALAEAERATTINRTLLSPWLIKAQIHADTKNWEEAAADMDEAIRLRPEEPDFYVNRAYLRYNLDNFLGAMEDYNYALQIESDYTPALFNRGLLRLEVRDLTRSAEDFSKVLELEPANFHARYNRGLIYLELGQPQQALKDFQHIAGKYPKFYPIYYAIAESYRNLGNLRLCAANINKADRMVEAYVSNPERNPLDRPAIASGSRQVGAESHPQSEEEVMEQFNRLVTVAPSQQTELAFNDRIKGKVQDRNMAIAPAPAYTLSPVAPANSLRNESDTFRELTEFNAAGYLEWPIYLVGESTSSASDFSQISDRINLLLHKEKEEGLRPADELYLATCYASLKNYDAALTRYDHVLASTPTLTPALFGRAQTLSALSTSRQSLELQLRALADLDAAIRLDPNNPYAWFNKASIHYQQRDYSEALASLNRVVAISPNLGAALYNRGLCLLQAGKKQEALADLSKAGELGVLPSYNLLKRMK